VVDTRSCLFALGLLASAWTCLGASPLKVVVFLVTGPTVKGIVSFIVFNCFLEVEVF
jgi:hypothetical protein